MGKASSFEVETSFPLQIEFKLSNACNFRCGFCPYSFPIDKRRKDFQIPKEDKIIVLIFKILRGFSKRTYGHRTRLSN